MEVLILVISVVLFLGLGVLFVVWMLREDLTLAIMLGLVYFVVVGFVFVVLTGLTFFLTTGLYEGYTEGYRIGYVTKLSQRGIIWKTWEGEMQSGVGELAALEGVHKFSVRNNKVLLQLKHLSSRRKVKLYYVGWLVMPFRYGDTNYEIVKVEKLRN